MLPPRDRDGRSISGGGGKGNEEGRAMILTSHMILAHESIVDSISMDSYNQKKAIRFLGPRRDKRFGFTNHLFVMASPVSN
jgi:hypothetical protein